MIVTYDPDRNVEELWEELTPLWTHMLEKVKTGFMMTPELLRQSVLEKNSQLWLIEAGEEKVGFFVTAICSSMKTPYAVIQWCCVEPQSVVDWAEIDAVVGEWAKANGCTHLFIDGRAGWGKVIPKEYQILTVTYSRAL